MGHWGTCPSRLPTIIFQITSEPHKVITANSIWFLFYIALKMCKIGDERRSITLR